MTRHTNIIRKWKYDEVGRDTGKSGNENKISAPLEHLKELKNSDYQMSDRLPNIYDWEIIDASTKKIGVVKDFLFDENEEKIRYLIAILEEGEVSGQDKNILIPIGKARLDQQKQKILLVQKVSTETLINLPTYKNVKSLAIEDEKQALLSFSGSTKEETKYTKENFYKRKEFNEESFYGTEPHEEI